MRRLLFSIVTFGERPDIAESEARDWLDYTDEYRGDHNSTECVFEFLRGAFGHVIWRVTRKADATLLPFAFMLAVQAGILTIFVIIGVPSITFDPRVELGLIIVFLLWVSSALRKPWDLSFRQDFAVLTMLFGIVELVTALTVSPATPLNVGSFLLNGLGGILVSISAMRQRLILGSSLTAAIVVSFGAVLAASRVAFNARGEGLPLTLGVATISIGLSMGVVYAMWRVWWAGQHVPQSAEVQTVAHDYMSDLGRIASQKKA